MKLESLYDLMVHETQDLYDAEYQITKALPKLVKAVTSDELKKSLENHLAQTQTHLERLEQVFEVIGQKPTRKPCKAMQGLLEEGNELMKEDIAPDVLEVGLIAASQRVEHYEMAGYGTLRTYAEILDYPEAAELLQKTLNEEGRMDEDLTVLARKVNKRAV